MSVFLSSSVKVVPIKDAHENRGLFSSWEGKTLEPFCIRKEVRTLDDELVAYLGVFPLRFVKSNGFESFFDTSSEVEYVVPIADVVQPDAVIDLYEEFNPIAPRLMSINVGVCDSSKPKHKVIIDFVQALKARDFDAFDVGYSGSFGAVLRGKGDYEGILAYDQHPYPTEYNVSLHAFSV